MADHYAQLQAMDVEVYSGQSTHTLPIKHGMFSLCYYVYRFYEYWK